MNDPTARNNRILIVDDQEQIHADYRKILVLEDVATREFVSAEADFFGEAATTRSLPEYEIESAYQGTEAVDLIEAACAARRPYAMAFMDVRMPPGIDGVETTRRVFEVDSEIQIVISTAYADYAWEDIYGEFGSNDRMLFLRKPFDTVEVHQVASTLTEKWTLARRANLRLDELESLVEQRTSELEHALSDLRTAQAQIVQAERMSAIGKLVAGLAHELNTPLGVLRSAFDVTERSVSIIRGAGATPGDEGAPMVAGGMAISDTERTRRVEKAWAALTQNQRMAAEATERVSELVGELRSFSRLDEAEKQELDLRDALDNTLNVLRASIPDRVEIVREYTDTPRVTAHARELNQVFHNLITNAVRAVDGDGRITLRVAPDSSTGEVVVVVEDTGRGIPPERLATLFDVQFSASSRVKMGWGLAIGHQILQRHGGSLTATSRPGVGSAFTVRLPATSGWTV